jgi:hypothetical protein
MEFDVKAAPFFISGKTKIGELTEGTVSIKGNGERVIVESGVIKTTGRATTDIDMEGLVPVNGMTFDAFAATISQQKITFMVQFNGHFYSVRGSFDEATMKTMVASGKTTGSFKFTGGQPVVNA